MMLLCRVITLLDVCILHTSSQCSVHSSVDKVRAFPASGILTRGTDGLTKHDQEFGCGSPVLKPHNLRMEEFVVTGHKPTPVILCLINAPVPGPEYLSAKEGSRIEGTSDG